MSDVIGFFYHVPERTRSFRPADLVNGTVDKALDLTYKAGFRDGFYAGVLLVLVVAIFALIARRKP